MSHVLDTIREDFLDDTKQEAEHKAHEDDTGYEDGYLRTRLRGGFSNCYPGTFEESAPDIKISLVLMNIDIYLHSKKNLK